jgi:hypothetical protein
MVQSASINQTIRLPSSNLATQEVSNDLRILQIASKIQVALKLSFLWERGISFPFFTSFIYFTIKRKTSKLFSFLFRTSSVTKYKGKFMIFNCLKNNLYSFLILPIDYPIIKNKKSFKNRK